MPETQTPYEPGTPCWIDLVVPDQQAALDFYAACFGWSGGIGPPDMGGYSLCALKGQPVAGIMSARVTGGQPAPPTVWTTYFTSRDCAASETAAARAGGSVLVPAMDVMTLGRMGVAADPAGAVFGVWQPKDFAGFGLAGEPGTRVWSELNTTDTDAAAPFYREALGLETTPMEGADDYFSLAVGGHTVGGMRETDTPGTPPHWLVYFAVRDTDRSADVVAEAGGTVTEPPFDIVAGRMAMVRDPQGASFALMTPRPPGTA